VYGLTSTKNFGGVTGGLTTLFHPPANVARHPNCVGMTELEGHAHYEDAEQDRGEGVARRR
jgi:hypothetical protein